MGAGPRWRKTEVCSGPGDDDSSGMVRGPDIGDTDVLLSVAESIGLDGKPLQGN